MLKHCLTILGTGYDTKGAILSPLRICSIEEKDKYFCSELVADLLKEFAGDYGFLKRGCKYSPNRLYEVLLRSVTNGH